MDCPLYLQSLRKKKEREEKKKKKEEEKVNCQLVQGQIYSQEVSSTGK